MRRAARLACAALMGGVLAGASAPGAHAQADAPSTFPFEVWSARASALGGAGSALGGLDFAPLNPAAIAGARGVLATRHGSPSDASDSYLAGAVGGRWGTLGLTFRRRDWGEVARDLGLDDLEAGEQAIGVGYGVRVGPVAVGVAGQRLDTDYLGARSSGWAVDAGARAALGQGVSVGASLLHGGGLTAEGDEGERRTSHGAQLRGGAAWELRAAGVGWTALADVAAPLRGGDPDLHAGLQGVAAAGPVRVSGRAGWRALGNPYGDGGRERAFTFGGGAEFARVRVDVAQAVGGTLGDETFVSLSIGW